MKLIQPGKNHRTSQSAWLNVATHFWLEECKVALHPVARWDWLKLSTQTSERPSWHVRSTDCHWDLVPSNSAKRTPLFDGEWLCLWTSWFSKGRRTGANVRSYGTKHLQFPGIDTCTKGYKIISHPPVLWYHVPSSSTILSRIFVDVHSQFSRQHDAETRCECPLRWQVKRVSSIIHVFMSQAKRQSRALLSWIHAKIKKKRLFPVQEPSCAVVCFRDSFSTYQNAEVTVVEALCPDIWCCCYW